MTKDVFAEKWEIAGKNGMNKSLARFPDVCLSPPSPPAGPIPVPYPDTSFSKDLKEGSETVNIGGKPAALAQKSYYKSSPLGNEAATRSFGASVITHQITGKTYFQAWAMTVKFEGKNVCRHIDITTSNHASQIGATPPAPTAETQDMKQAKAAIKAGKCPCCGNPLHKWQKDPKTKRPYGVMTAGAFWRKQISLIKVPDKQAEKDTLTETLERMNRRKTRQRKKRKDGKPSCPNVQTKENQGCALHFDIPQHRDNPVRYRPTKKDPAGPTAAKSAYRAFSKTKKKIVTSNWSSMNPTNPIPAAYPPPNDPWPGKLNHKTPRMAGGCNDTGNVVVQHYMNAKACNDIEEDQKALENVANYIY